MPASGRQLLRMSKDALKDLELLLRSRYGLIHLDTREEDRANSLLLHLADARKIPLFTWTRTRGLVRAGMSDSVYQTQDPVKALRHVATARIPALYHFEGLAGAFQGQGRTCWWRS